MSDKNFMSYGDAEPLFAEIGSELGKRVEQYSTMPSASSTLLNKIVQYIGNTSESYINGFFYKCVYNEDEADYEWIKIDMGGGITITATLLASGWDANNQQTIVFDGYSSSMNGVIGVPTSATSAQKTAYAEAIINVVNQVDDNFTFEAVNVPSIDLPVVVYAGGGSGSGGTTVVANPEGAATANLNKLQIDETIYQIVGGGSSGGGIAPLDTEIRTEWNVDYELADSIANYDLILIQMYFTGEENTWTGTRLFYVDALRDHDGIWIDGGNNDRALRVSFTDDTHYRIIGGNYYNGIHGVYGINIGAGSGGSVVSEIIEIQSGDDTTSRTFTFERVPEKIFVSYNSTDNWYGFWSFIWGDEYAVFAAHPKGVSGAGNSGGIGSISYGSDGKSFTITGENAFQAWNMVGGYGQMFIEYSGNIGGASAVSDLTDVELDNLSNGQILQYNSTTQKWENVDNQGGGGSEYSKTNLWKGEQTTSAELQLSEAITNYDIIEFVCGFNSTDKAHMSFTYDVQQFLIDFPYVANPTNTIPHFLPCIFDTAYFRAINGSSDDKIYIWDLSEHTHPTKLYEINGIKLGSGNGSESEFSADVLFDGSDATSLQSSITLTTPWSNYDAIAFATVEYYQNREYRHTHGIILKDVLQSALDTLSSAGGWIDINAQSTAVYAFGKVESTIEFTNIYGSSAIHHIDKVYGLTFGAGAGSSSSNHEIVQTRDTRMQDNLVVTINLEKKYTNPYVFAVNTVPKTSWGGLVVVNQSATITYDDTNNTLSFSVYTNSAQNYDVDWLVFDLDGSGGGTDVEANPTGTPTAELNSIRIGQDIYKIAGGESSGSGFEQTVLWDYETDNEGSVLFGLATATLHDAVENYDALLIDVVSVSSDMTDATWKSTFQFHIDVKALSESFNPNYILCESAANRTSRYYIQGTTLQKTSQATDNTNGLVRVYGLKFGGGSNGAFTDEVIFENTESTNPNTITLSNAYTEYDEIVIKYTRPSNEGDYTWNNTYLVEALPLNSKIELTGWQPEGQYLHYTFTNETTLTIYNQGGGVIIREIHGLKFGGNSSENKYSFTNLWTGSQSTAGEITLNDNIENYDLIQFICQISNGGCSVDTFDTNYFLTEFPYKANPTANDKHYCPSTWDNTYARVITGTSTNKLYTWDFTNYQRITAVNGIKLDGGTGTVDTAMSDTSTNAVQNKAIKKYIDDAIAEFVDLTTSDIDDIINDVFGS